MRKKSINYKLVLEFIKQTSSTYSCIKAERLMSVSLAIKFNYRTNICWISTQLVQSDTLGLLTRRVGGFYSSDQTTISAAPTPPHPAPARLKFDNDGGWLVFSNSRHILIH